MQSEGKQAAIYCRVAYADDSSMESQRHALRRFATAQGYPDCVEYLDNGESGLSYDRPAFTRLHNDMFAGKIRVVFVENISRIGRDAVATMQWLAEAQELGVEVVSQF